MILNLNFFFSHSFAAFSNVTSIDDANAQHNLRPFFVRLGTDVLHHFGNVNLFDLLDAI